MNKLSAAIVITSQGIPFSLGGEEFCRSKDGDENSYASSRKENMLDWENVDLYSDVIEYYRGLYKIRDALRHSRILLLQQPTALHIFPMFQRVLWATQ